MKNFKELVTLLVLILFISCEKAPEKKVSYKYKKGDIVYLKLDGTKVMIARPMLLMDEPTYEIYYKSSNGSYASDAIQEFCLMDKKEKGL
jgi:hypothetical protein